MSHHQVTAAEADATVYVAEVEVASHGTVSLKYHVGTGFYRVYDHEMLILEGRAPRATEAYNHRVANPQKSIRLAEQMAEFRAALGRR